MEKCTQSKKITNFKYNYKYFILLLFHRWSPVSVAAMAYEPIIKISPELDDLIMDKKKGLVDSCPAKVFKLNDKTHNVEIVN